MSASQILTKEIAEQYLKDPSFYLGHYTSIDDSAAEFLAQPKGDLRLDGLTSLSDVAAKALGQHKGSLGLKGLKSLSVAAATSLAKAKPLEGEFNCIRLDSLSLTPEVAAGLAEYRGDQIVFHCPSIDLETVKAFRPFKGQLWLGCVTHLDDDLAAELAARSGGAYLDGVAQYPNTPGYRELARALCSWNRQSWLGLRGANSIAPEVVEILARFDGVEILGTSEMQKELRAARLSRVRRAGLEKPLASPLEWNGGRIFPNNGPAKPLTGRGAERVEAGSASWWLPKKVCDWFVQKLHDTHKAPVRGDGYGASRTLQISPEAAGLLRDKAEVWLGLSEIELAATKAQIKGKLKSLASMEAPREFRNGRIVLPPPEKPLGKVYRWKPDFDGQDYQSVLHYYTYLPAEHMGSIMDPNGYPAKAMSPEAAALYQRNRAFWEAKQIESKSQAKAAGAERAKTAKKRVEKAALAAGITSKELDAKLDRLSELANEDNLTLVADMVAGFGEAWLYEALLAGASITPEGGLKPGRVLKRFKERAEIIMLLAIASMPEGVEVDPSIRTDAPISMTVNAKNVDLVAESIAPQLPNLKPRMQGLEYLESLLSTTATFLVRQERVLSLHGLQKVGIAEARTLSSLEGDIYLDGLRQIDPGVAEALARVRGRLSFGGLSSVSEQVARELGSHVGDLSLNLKELPESIAASLACCKGDLELLGLKTITSSAAAELAKHCGKLTLGEDDGGSGFRLGADAAECLARHSGPVALPSLKRVTAETALALSSLSHHIEVENIVEFPNGIAGARLCERIAMNPDDSLTFYDLKRLQPECAAALAAFTGSLYLSVDNWNDAALVALAPHQDSLEVDAKHISDDVGYAFGERGVTSELKLGSVSMTDVVAQALGKYPGKLEVSGDLDVSVTGAGHLVERASMSLYRSKIKPAVRKVFESAGSWSDSTWTRNP